MPRKRIQHGFARRLLQSVVALASAIPLVPVGEVPLLAQETTAAPAAPAQAKLLLARSARFAG